MMSSVESDDIFFASIVVILNFTIFANDVKYRQQSQ